MLGVLAKGLSGGTVLPGMVLTPELVALGV